MLYLNTVRANLHIPWTLDLACTYHSTVYFTLLYRPFKCMHSWWCAIDWWHEPVPGHSGSLFLWYLGHCVW